MAKYRKKPVVIEAFLLNERGLIEEDWFWDAVTRNDIITHCFGKHELDPAWCEIKTPEGIMVGKAGGYIIRGVAGEIYPCKADIFQKTYDSELPMTNAERIRTMSDEELAAFLDSTKVCDGHPLEECALKDISRKACILKWLQQPTEGE